MNITISSIKKQWQRLLDQGWLPYFQEAAQQFNFEPSLLIAVASRETNLDPHYLQVPGDNGNGYGLMQVDKRSYPNWVKSGKWKDARESIRQGAFVLKAKRDAIIGRAGQIVTVHFSNGESRQFRMPALAEPELTQVTVAAYNAGDAAPYHASKKRSPDTGTTGGDYSTDVLARAAEFQKLIDAESPVQDNPTGDYSAP